MTYMESKFLVQILMEWKVKLDKGRRKALEDLPDDKKSLWTKHSNGFGTVMKNESLTDLDELSEQINNLILRVNHGIALQQEQDISKQVQE